MPNSMDVQRLIAEVKKRPTLWDVRLAEYKDRTHSVRLWVEISKIMGCDVEQCKRKWKNLRDAYRAEVRRTERRIQRLKLEGHADPKVSDSKWIYFQPMSFMNDSKRKRYSSSTAANASSSNDYSNDSHEAYTPEAEAEADADADADAEAETEADVEATEHIDMENYCNVKMEPPTSTDDEADLINAAANADCDGIPTLTNVNAIANDDDDEEANDMLFEQFKSVATPQAARRLSGTLTMGGGIGIGIGVGIDSNSPTTTMAMESITTTSAAATSTSSNAYAPIVIASNGSANNSQVSIPTCKCSQRAEDQVHFLEDLEREEQQLMQSTRRDITRASLNHFGDSDYNFLVSFLPQMKRLNNLQNLQFRAKMSDLMLRIMAHPMTQQVATTTMSSGTLNCISTTTPCQQGHFDCSTTSTQQQQSLRQQHKQQLQQQQHF